MREICAKVSKFQQSHAQKKRKAKKRHSDTTFFAKSAESAKPISALNGAGDGSLWVAEYLTINERIAN